MKTGDIVKHKIDGDVGLILAVDGITTGCDPELYEILWSKDGYKPFQCYGFNGDHLELTYESR